MQEANTKSWTRESQVSVGMLESLCELNQRFLGLTAAAGEWGSARRAACPPVGHMMPLSAEQRKAAASCPYALFDLRFHDAAFWCPRLLTAERRVEENFSGDQQDSFARLALFYAWHVATIGRLASRLLLGMSELTADSFRSVTIDCLPALVSVASCTLTARWSHCSVYWNALAGAAARTNAAHLRRVQLYGLQLAATAGWS